MTYADLRDCMRRFRAGEMSRIEMIAALGLWQRAGAPR